MEICQKYSSLRRQQAHNQFIREGDDNSAFFNAMLKHRKHRSTIYLLKYDLGANIMGSATIKAHVLVFIQIYCISPPIQSIDPIVIGMVTVLTLEMREVLIR